MSDVRIVGLEQFLQNLDQLVSNTIDGARRALMIEGEIEMTISKTDYVPVDTGTLRSTGHVETPEVSGTEVVVRLGYGGPAASYAWTVHEDLTARHRVGQAKYLETPVRQEMASGRAIQRMASIIREEIL